MDNRRRLLSNSSADKGLYIYKKGFTTWENATATIGNNATVTFGSDSVVVTNPNSANITSKVNLLVPQSVYGEYSKLVFKAYATHAKGRVVWDASIIAGVPGEEIETYPSTSPAQEYSVDISQSTGDRYIVIIPYYKNATVTVYDIHFE